MSVIRAAPPSLLMPGHVRAATLTTWHACSIRHVAWRFQIALGAKAAQKVPVQFAGRRPRLMQAQVAVADMPPPSVLRAIPALMPSWGFPPSGRWTSENRPVQVQSQW